MREYAKVSPKVWQSRKFRDLPGDDARLLYFYLHTSPQANSLGCYVLPPGYGSADLRWSESRYRAALEALCEAGLAGWDERENLVRITQFLRHDPLTNPNHATAAVKLVLKLPPSPETVEVIRELLDSGYIKNPEPLLAALRAMAEPVAMPIESHPDAIPMGIESHPDAIAMGIETQNQNQRQRQRQSSSDHHHQSSDSRDNEPTWREELLIAMGLGRDGITGPNGRMLGKPSDMLLAQRWKDELGLTEAEIIAEIRSVMDRRKSTAAVGGFSYFTDALRRFSAIKHGPALTPDETAAIEPPKGKQAKNEDTLRTILAAAAASTGGAH